MRGAIGGEVVEDGAGEGVVLTFDEQREGVVGGSREAMPHQVLGDWAWGEREVAAECGELAKALMVATIHAVFRERAERDSVGVSGRGAEHQGAEEIVRFRALDHSRGIQCEDTSWEKPVVKVQWKRRAMWGMKREREVRLAYPSEPCALQRPHRLLEFVRGNEKVEIAERAIEVSEECQVVGALEHDRRHTAVPETPDRRLETTRQYELS